jgi:hypothetical protein
VPKSLCIGGRTDLTRERLSPLELSVKEAFLFEQYIAESDQEFSVLGEVHLQPQFLWAITLRQDDAINLFFTKMRFGMRSTSDSPTILRLNGLYWFWHILYYESYANKSFYFTFRLSRKVVRSFSSLGVILAA